MISLLKQISVKIYLFSVQAGITVKLNAHFSKVSSELEILAQCKAYKLPLYCSGFVELFEERKK